MNDEPDKRRRAPFSRREGAERPERGERDPKRSFNRRQDRQEEDASAGERIAKRLARAGISSRREAESLITDGRVRVNGQVLSSPAFNVQPGDRIELDGQAIPEPERTRLFLFHKPAGIVTTNRDPEGRRTVFDALPEGLPRVMTVGRLDINTEGLLLLTNDGGLARVLELPATGWLRRYRARVHGAVDEAKLKELREGVAVDGVFYGAIEAELERTQGSNAWLTLGLREGKNREVKNVLGSLGLEVNRLIRISYGPFQLGELEEGHVQEIKGRMLRDQLGERLIEESGADFEAEIRQPFSNRPTVRGSEPETPVAKRDAPRPEPGEGGLIKNRKRERERFREDGLKRLGTKPDRPRSFGKGSGAKPGRDRQEEARPEPRPRTANVWMAPGARPLSKDKAAASPRPARQEGDRPFKPRGPKPFRDGGGERREGKPRERREGDAPGGEERAPRQDFRSRPPRDDNRSRESGDFRPRRPREEGERPARFNPDERRESRPQRRPGGEDRPQQHPFNGAPREGGGEGKPFRERPRGDGKPRAVSGEARPDGAAKPFRKGPRPSGAGKPYGTGPRPDGGGEKRFDKRPRPEGERREGKPSGFKPAGGYQPSGGKPGAAKRPFKPRDNNRGDR